MSPGKVLWYISKHEASAVARSTTGRGRDPVPIQAVNSGRSTLACLCRVRHLRKELLKDGLEPPEHVLAVLRDLVVRYKPAPGDGQALLAAELDEALDGAAGTLDVQPHHVGVNGMDQRAAHAGPQGLDRLGHLVGGLQPAVAAVGGLAKGLVDGDAGGGGEHAGLAHAAADGLADPAGVADDVAGPDEDAADGGAEALGEAQAKGVEGRAHVGQGAGAGGAGLPQAGAVAVQADAVAAGEGGDAPDLGERHDHAVEGVLEADDARGAGPWDVLAEHGVSLHVLERKVDAVAWDDGCDESAAQRCDAAREGVSVSGRDEGG